MPARLTAVLFAAFFLSLAGAAAADARRGPAEAGTARRAQYSKAAPGAQSCFAHERYSVRARRRAAALLRLHVWELRKEQLERARRAVERALPLDSLLSDEPGGAGPAPR